MDAVHDIGWGEYAGGGAPAQDPGKKPPQVPRTVYEGRASLSCLLAVETKCLRLARPRHRRPFNPDADLFGSRAARIFRQEHARHSLKVFWKELRVADAARAEVSHPLPQAAVPDNMPVLAVEDKRIRLDLALRELVRTEGVVLQ